MSETDIILNLKRDIGMLLCPGLLFYPVHDFRHRLTGFFSDNDVSIAIVGGGGEVQNNKFGAVLPRDNRHLSSRIYDKRRASRQEYVAT